jgi:alpha-glucoside transport system substrate-binding protein
MRWRRLVQAITIAAVLALVTSACLSEGGDSGGSGGNTGGATAPGDKNVEVMWGFGGGQSKAFQASMKEFERSSGIKVKLTEAAQSFDTLIRTRTQGNNFPDVALFPQPGVMLDIAKSGKMQDLGAILDLNQLKTTLVPGELDAATKDGKTYGVPVVMNVKSLVWYPKKAFEAKGYTIPTTLAELETLTQKIKADGTAPWCVGIESAAATGWPATDWIEDMVLRLGGPETYDKWTRHEIPFNDPIIKQSAEQFEKLALTEGNVFGGRKAVVSNAFATAANPMFENPPKCMLHRQGNFITQQGFFPDKVRQNMDENVGVFQLPGKTAEDKPVLGGGDLIGAFTNDTDTKAVLEYLTSPNYKGWVEEGGYISPHKTYDVSQYRDKLTADVAQLAYQSTVFRFDGSDVMPGAVGAGSFWKGMVSWISGQKDLDTALKDIEDSWPN